MEITQNPTLFVYKKHHDHPRCEFGLFLTWQASSKTVKIHPLGNHAASYRQRGWDFIYPGCNTSEISCMGRRKTSFNLICYNGSIMHITYVTFCVYSYAHIWSRKIVNQIMLVGIALIFKVSVKHLLYIGYV